MCLLLAGILPACGLAEKNKGLSEEAFDKPAGVRVLLDKKFEAAAVGDSGVKVNRMRAWQRNPNSEFASSTTGDAPDFDLVTLELWFQIDGETQQRYRKITGLRKDENGWLFPTETLGGHNEHDDIETPFSIYQPTAEEAFVLDEVPQLFKYDRATNIVLDAKYKTVQQQVITRVTLPTSDAKVLGAVRTLTFASGANLLGEGGVRTVWKKNEKSADGYALKGKLACLVETRNGGSTGNGGFNPIKIVSQDVELGDYIHNLDGSVEATPGGATECKGGKCGAYSGLDAVADDEIWVRYEETYNLLGVNIDPKNRAISLIKTASAPIYLNRELPAPFASGGADPSGVESSVRRCNDEAVQNASAVAANPILGTESGDPGAYSIQGTIGFRLIANGRRDDASGFGTFMSPLAGYCDAMPDTNSPSAGLSEVYSALTNENNGIVNGITNCGMSIPGVGIAPEYLSAPLGTILDQYIAPGGWSGEESRHIGAALSPTTAATDRPLHRVQVSGSVSLK